MSEAAEETKLCEICGIQIAISKFRMHQIGCARYYKAMKEQEKKDKEEEALRKLEEAKNPKPEEQKKPIVD